MSQRILIVEDEWLQGQDITNILREAGFESIGPFISASAALDALNAAKYDRALLDLNLRGVPSFDIADALMQRATPFAFLTAHAQSWLPERFCEFPIIAKPFQSKQLLSAVDALLLIPEAA